MSMKNSNYTIGNRILFLPTYSALPQPTAPPRAPNSLCKSIMSHRCRLSDEECHMTITWGLLDFAQQNLGLCGSWNRLSIPVLVQDMCITACYWALELDVSRIDSDACAKKCGTVAPVVCATRTSVGFIVSKQRGGKLGLRAVSYFSTDRTATSFVTI
jgi:hypothetical protein